MLNTELQRTYSALRDTIIDLRYSTVNSGQKQAITANCGATQIVAGPGTGKTTVIINRIDFMVRFGLHYGTDHTPKNLTIDDIKRMESYIKNTEAGRQSTEESQVFRLLGQEAVSPENILVVTFSKAAAMEMQHRFMKRNAVMGSRAGNVSFGTFHSIFFKILKNYKGYKLENLIDESHKFSIIKSILRKLHLGLGEEEEQVSDIISDIGYVMSTMMDVEDYEPISCKSHELKQIMDSYDTYKQSTGKFDYDDMLLDCYTLLKGNERILNTLREKFKYILVDEFQDINKLQFETIKLLAAPANNLFVVGDDDQSIYSFRGATPDILMQFEKLYPGCQKIFLRQNYRCSKNILASATAVINNNTGRFVKNLESMQEYGGLPVLFETEDFEDEAKVIASKIRKKHEEGIGFSRMSIIYRTNLQSRAIVDALMDCNIPFNAADGAASIYHHWIFKDILAYFKLSHNINNSRELMRVLNKPKRYISREAMEKAERMEGSFLYNLINYTGLNNLQVNALYELEGHIKRIARLTPELAVKFIRGPVGYESYLRDYALSKGIGIKGLIEALDEAESAAENFETVAEYLAHVEAVEAEIKAQKKKAPDEDRVELLTMHRAKGLEFDIVFIIGSIDGLAPYIKEDKERPDAIEEERRLFYVAMTRAKKELYISIPKTRFKQKTKPSRFLEEFSDKNIRFKNQISIGQKIYHKIYNEGVIRHIAETQEGSTRVKADFGGSVKELNLNTCLQNDLVKIIG